MLSPTAVTNGWIAVSVLGPTGLPLADALVSDGLGQQVPTDAAGEALLEGLAGQIVDVTVSEANGRALAEHDLRRRRPGGGQFGSRDAALGTPPPDALVIGTFVCALCHTETAASHSATPHGDPAMACPTSSTRPWA